MDVFPKFIIEGDALILQKATYHRDIATDSKQVKGGGWFFYSDKTNTFQLDGTSTSEDFGTAKLDDIKECIRTGNVFTGRGRHRNIATDHKFSYNTGSATTPLARPLKLCALREGDQFVFEDHFSDSVHKVLERRKPGPGNNLVKVEKPSGNTDLYDGNSIVIIKNDIDGN